MSRLLEPDEICKACPAYAMRTTEHAHLRCDPAQCLVHPDFKCIAKAQNAKTAAIVRKEVNEEWVSVLRNHSYDRITAVIPDIEGLFKDMEAEG